MSQDLARRAIACRHWRWMPGMLTLPFHEDDDRSLPECHPAWRVSRAGIAVPWAHDPTWGALPDLTDPATLGCLLALVREAWEDGGLITRRKVRRSGVSWWVVFYDADQGRMRSTREQPTEAAALIAALESAP